MTIRSLSASIGDAEDHDILPDMTMPISKQRASGAEPSRDDYQKVIFAWREMRRGVAMGAYRDLLFEGFDLGALDALDLLVAKDRVRMIDFASALRVEKSTATRAVDRLESAGLALRQVVNEPARRPAVFVNITRRGRALHEKLLLRRVQLLKQMTHDFTPAEIVTLGGLLERLVRGIDHVVAEARRATDAGKTSPTRSTSRATGRS